VRRGGDARADAGVAHRRLPVPVLPAGGGARRKRRVSRLAPLYAAIALLALPGGAPGADLSLIGEWSIVAAEPAPWADEARHPELAARGKRLIGVVIDFNARTVVSKHKPFACRRARYEPTTYPADAMFQGNLPEPNPAGAAARFGFAKGDIAGVDLRCNTGVFSYHFRDRDTALTALDNVIYTLKRK
jgi:hypothetical protein